MKNVIFVFFLIFLFTGRVALASTGTIDPSATNHALVCHDVTCTTPTPGIINFELAGEPYIEIDSDLGITGRAWGNELGWILFDPVGEDGVTFANATTGLLTGRAWSQVSGWINFGLVGEEVFIDPNTGEFDGWAWTGGAYGGWIKFDCTDPDACVRTTWRAGGGEDDDSGQIGGSRPGGGGGGSGSIGVSHIGGEGEDGGDSGEESGDGSGGSEGESGGNGTGEGGEISTPAGDEPFFSFPNPLDWGDESNRDGGAMLRMVIWLLTIALPLTISAILFIKLLASGVSFLNFLAYLFFFIPQLLRFKRLGSPWGVVYDSYTKRPIPFAKVDILNSVGRKLQTTIADIDGRYGFLLGEEFIQSREPLEIKAAQNNYIFPSDKEPTPSEKILYEHTYHGGLVSVSSETANFDLPMDPTKPEVMAKIFPYFGIVSIKLNNFWTDLANILFFAGMIFGLTGFVLNPGWQSFIPVGLTGLTLILRISGVKLKPFGRVKDKKTRAAMPFALVTLNNKSERVNFTVSDTLGRYFLLSPRGKFTLSAFTPAEIMPQRETDVSLATPKGWVSREIKL